VFNALCHGVYVVCAFGLVRESKWIKMHGASNFKALTAIQARIIHK
jgi:hypothetical protein